MSCEQPKFDRSVEEHRQAILAMLRPLHAQTLPLDAAAGRVLAADVHGELPVPAFDNSAMDGFLVHAADLERAHDTGEALQLEVVADVAAGHPAATVPPGKAVRIMTGAAIGNPHASLAVVPVEHTDAEPTGPAPAVVRVLTPDPKRQHIRRAGEDAQRGDVIARAGSLIDPGTLAALISCGVVRVEAHALPHVTVLSSGDELAAPGAALEAGQIPDSNRPMITELIRGMGMQVTQVHVPDDPAALKQALHEASAGSDLIVSTGGVSAGAFDVVKDVLASRVWFGSVAMQPGKPQGAGMIDSGTRAVPMLCLPGNPVSAFVSFYLFVLPAVRRLAGASVDDCSALPIVPARFVGELPPNGPREQFIPARLRFDQGVLAAPAFDRGVGSHRVASLSQVRGLIRRAPHAPALDTGESVDLLLLSL